MSTGVSMASQRQSRRSQDNEAVRKMSKALGHGEVITIHPSLHFNADDMSVMIHTGDKPSREVRAVPHNDHRAHFASFQLNNPDPARDLGPGHRKSRRGTTPWPVASGACSCHIDRSCRACRASSPAREKYHQVLININLCTRACFHADTLLHTCTCEQQGWNYWERVNMVSGMRC